MTYLFADGLVEPHKYGLNCFVVGIYTVDFSRVLVSGIHLVQRLVGLTTAKQSLGVIGGLK